MYEDLVPERVERGNTKRSTKFVLPCQKYADSKDKAWLSVTSMLSETQPVLTGVLKNNKAVVIKHGSVQEIEKDYAFSKRLSDAGIPNIIKYYCKFTCKDTARYVNNNRQLFERNRNFLCNGTPDGPEDIRGFVVMPYYPLGDISSLPIKGEGRYWIYKNLLTQVFCASLYAYAQTGFIHGDMNSGNVLFRKTTKKDVTYGDWCTIPVDSGIYAVVMDFGLSTMATSPTDVNLLYRGLKRYITLAEQVCDYDSNFSVVLKTLNDLTTDETPVTSRVARSLIQSIEAAEMNFSKSDRGWR